MRVLRVTQSALRTGLRRLASLAGACSAIALLFLGPLQPQALAGESSRDYGHPEKSHRADTHRSGRRWYERAMDAHHDERYEEAIAGFQKALELGFRPAASAYNVACGLARLGQTERAFEWLVRAEREGFDVLDAMGGDEDLDSLRSSPRWAEFRRGADARQAAFRREEAAQLERQLQALRARNPSDGEAFERLGRKLYELRAYGPAAEAYQEAASRGAGASTSLYNAACSRALQGDTQQALQLLERALHEGFAGVRHMREDEDLEALHAEPRFEQLLRLAQALALPDEGSSWGWRRGLREPREQRQAWAREVPRYADFARTNPRLGRAWSNLGHAQLRAGNPEESARAFRTAAELGYRTPTSLYNLACAQAQGGQTDAALQSLTRALDAGFDSTHLLRNDEDLDPLRGDARLVQVLERAKAQERARYARHHRAHDAVDED